MEINDSAALILLNLMMRADHRIVLFCQTYAGVHSIMKEIERLAQVIEDEVGGKVVEYKRFASDQLTIKFKNGSSIYGLPKNLGTNYLGGVRGHFVVIDNKENWAEDELKEIALPMICIAAGPKLVKVHVGVFSLELGTPSDLVTIVEYKQDGERDLHQSQ